MKRKFDLDDINISRKEVEEIIEQYVHSLTARSILRDYFLDRASVKELADKFLCSPETIKKIVRKYGLIVWDKVTIK